MTRYKRYQDYVIKDGKFVGEFEQMYKDFYDPWKQNEREKFAPDKAVCIDFITAFRRKRTIEFGCGLGDFTQRISEVSEQTLGVDISLTAIKKAESKHLGVDFKVSSFPDLALLRQFKPDCIVMAEITWFILDELDLFIAFLRSELPHTLLIHMLTVYKEGEQKYGTDKFSSLEQIKQYFDMNYYECGEIAQPELADIRRTFFAGSFKDLEYS